MRGRFRSRRDKTIEIDRTGTAPLQAKRPANKEVYVEEDTNSEVISRVTREFGFFSFPEETAPATPSGTRLGKKRGSFLNDDTSSGFNEHFPPKTAPKLLSTAEDCFPMPPGSDPFPMPAGLDSSSDSDSDDEFLPVTFMTKREKEKVALRRRGQIKASSGWTDASPRAHPNIPAGGAAAAAAAAAAAQAVAETTRVHTANIPARHVHQQHQQQQHHHHHQLLQQHQHTPEQWTCTPRTPKLPQLRVCAA